MSEEAPPLKVWAYAAVAIFSLLLLFLSYAYLGFGPYAKSLEKCHQSLEAALIENNKGDTSTVSIVILGSSLTERALLYPKEMADSIARKTGRKVNVLRVAIFYMNMDLAERIDFFDHVTNNPPQYLFIENFAINLDDNEEGISIPVPIDAVLLDLRNRLRSLAGLAPHEDYYNRWYTYDIKPSPGNDFYTDNFDSATFKALQMKKNVVRKISQNGVANRAYEALSKKNTKVIFLDMPQSDKLQPNFLDENATAELNALMEYYQQNYNVDYWRYPGTMNDSCFMDGAHFNYKGAMKYQDWFVSEFASIK